MSRSVIEFPEAATKVVERLRVYGNPPAGREVHLQFTDGTALSIEVNLQSVISARYYRDHQGDIEVIRECRHPSVDPDTDDAGRDT